MLQKTVLFIFVILCITFCAKLTLAQEDWKSYVYGLDWKADIELITSTYPEIIDKIPSTVNDESTWTLLSEDTKEQITNAVNSYYRDSAFVNNREFESAPIWEVTAARRLEGFILLWIEESYVADGGRSLIYSVEKNKIVGDFWDGGIRG